MFGFGRRHPLPPVAGRITRPSFLGYTPATRFNPGGLGVGAGIMVFEGGVNRTKAASITGGGQIYGHEFTAMGMGNIIIANAPGLTSMVGGGQIASRPAWLQALAGGRLGIGS